MFSKYFLSAQSFIMWVLFLDNYSTLFNANESREVVCEWGRLWKQNTCSQKPNGGSFCNPSTKEEEQDGVNRQHGLHGESEDSLGYMKLCFKKAEIIYKRKRRTTLTLPFAI